MALRVTILFVIFVVGIIANAMIRGGGTRGLSSLRPVPILRVLAPPMPDPAEFLPPHEEDEEAEEIEQQRSLGELAGQMYLVPKPFSVEELSELQRKLEKARTRYEERTSALEVMLGDLERVREDLEYRRQELEQLRKEIAQAHAADKDKGREAAAQSETSPAKGEQENEGATVDGEQHAAEEARNRAKEQVAIGPEERSRLKSVAKIYEATKPDSAARQLAALEPIEAAKILSVMKSRSSAKVLSAMKVEQAAELVGWMRKLTVSKGGQEEARR